MKPVLILILFSQLLFAQKKPSINYLNEVPPSQIAKVFADGIMSTSQIEHSAPAFSPDGRKVLWAIMKMPSYRMKMLEMNYVNGQWSVPKMPAFSDSLSDFSFPDFSVDGKTLFFSSNRRVNQADTLTKGNRLWYVSLNGDKWGEPQLVEKLKSYGGIYANSIAANGNMYFTFGPHRSSDWNILYSGIKDINPSPLPTNTKSYEDGPYIHPKEEYMIFESNRTGSIGNSTDLYISFKKNGAWSEPVNMGSKINTPFSERFARVSPDGKYLFFGSNRNGNFDIFWIDASIINEFK
ncbi:TolB family protein [Emticicia sp. BO119]|uniref:TolB family protein n=1 Tax=Emticicia sp. BO119 TaxID=2757768 RepID=UPI0015F10EAD|nr:PD40 domain-containing protein [Emticicia sp. BO119]MBA4849219.1 PD40 domain-containing protein [Emticicia sp. BO119]